MQIAPLTLAIGDDPSRGNPARRAYLANLTPSITWTPPALVATAAWNVPAVVASVTPFTSQQMQLVLSWPTPTWGAQASETIAPLTLARGDQPPPFQRQVMPWPDAPFPMQLFEECAGWNVSAPAFVPSTRPLLVVAAATWNSQAPSPVAAIVPVLGAPLGRRQLIALLSWWYPQADVRQLRSVLLRTGPHVTSAITLLGGIHLLDTTAIVSALGTTPLVALLGTTPRAQLIGTTPLILLITT